MSAFIMALLWPPIWAAMFARFWPQPARAVYGMACAAVGGVIADSLPPLDLPALAVSSSWVIAAALIWWWRRRKDRRKALAALGAKSRALIAAMVTRMRERPARPVLIPSPGGAS